MSRRMRSILAAVLTVLLLGASATRERRLGPVHVELELAQRGVALNLTTDGVTVRFEF